MNANPDNLVVAQFDLSSRANVLRAARDLGEPRDASRTLRRNSRAFGSLPCQTEPLPDNLGAFSIPASPTWTADTSGDRHRHRMTNVIALAYVPRSNNECPVLLAFCARGRGF